MTQDILSNGIKNETIFTADNLHILRGMDSECIDLIYLDPPFNSGHDYAAPIGSLAAGAEFTDTWKWNDDIHTYWLEILKKEHPNIGNLIDVLGDINGKSDKAYLTYMAPRLVHMRRVLKDTGSLYLHCDPTMSHSIKLMLDAIFDGRKNHFRNEIIWCYGESARGGKAKSKSFARNHDNIFFYSKSKKYTFEKIIWEEKNTKMQAQKKGFIEENGKWFKTAPRGNYTDKSIEKLRKEGRIHINSKGTIRIKYTLNLKDGHVYEKKQRGSVWTDIPDAMHMKGTGFNTQKPLKLLERIIEASSNEGDWVLDPFCGCATTCLAAHELKRNWIGIDVGSKAYDLIKMRFAKELPLLTDNTIHRTDLPRQSDIFIPKRKDLLDTLYGKQHGNCNGCREHFTHPRHFHIDHITPSSKGGQDHAENKQLLCGNCNSIKGDRDMAHLKARLVELEVIPAS